MSGLENIKKSFLPYRVGLELNISWQRPTWYKLSKESPGEDS